MKFNSDLYLESTLEMHHELESLNCFSCSCSPRSGCTININTTHYNYKLTILQGVRVPLSLNSGGRKKSEHHAMHPMTAVIHLEDGWRFSNR